MSIYIILQLIIIIIGIRYTQTYYFVTKLDFKMESYDKRIRNLKKHFENIFFLLVAREQKHQIIFNSNNIFIDLRNTFYLYTVFTIDLNHKTLFRSLNLNNKLIYQLGAKYPLLLTKTKLFFKR